MSASAPMHGWVSGTLSLQYRLRCCLHAASRCSGSAGLQSLVCRVEFALHHGPSRGSSQVPGACCTPSLSGC